tara:strand:- start:180 stop:491 length:312 start_codon:yes stop_codon:yes gene_type:complete
MRKTYRTKPIISAFSILRALHIESLNNESHVVLRIAALEKAMADKGFSLEMAEKAVWDAMEHLTEKGAVNCTEYDHHTFESSIPWAEMVKGLHSVNQRRLQNR